MLLCSGFSREEEEEEEGGGRGENVCLAAELKKLLPSIFVSLSLSIAWASGELLN